MTLRSDAQAAYEASQSGRESDARTVLADALSPEDVSGLTVADVMVTPAFTRFVFTDGDLNLAVILAATSNGGNSVHLVTGSQGNWTDRGTVASLAALGKVVPTVLPAAPAPAPAGPAAWAPQSAYAVGDQVTYQGKTYKCIQAHTSQVGWEPPNVPALWNAA